VAGEGRGGSPLWTGGSGGSGRSSGRSRASPPRDQSLAGDRVEPSSSKAITPPPSSGANTPRAMAQGRPERGGDEASPVALTISVLLGEDVVALPPNPRRPKVPVPPHSKLMARIFSHVRVGVSLAIVVLGVVALGSQAHASPSPNSGAVVGTPLPAGWELCVLDGVGAPGTADNVADLDEWQVVEGGSTNNAAAYNPFNVRQVTDSTGAPLPAVIGPGGFPAFATWAAGCAATVATLLQPVMAPIVTALMAGDVSVPGIFLFDVDQSPWCAPSADGIPCYATEVLAGEIVQAILNGSSRELTGSLTSYSNTGADLQSYEEAAYVTAADTNLVTAKNVLLVASEHAVSAARATLSRARRALRRLALDDYTDAAASRFESSLPLMGSPDQRDTIGQFYRTIAASLLTDQYDRAETGVRASLSRRQAAASAVAHATSLLDSAQSAENQTLSGLETDVKSVEAGLACTAPSVVTAAASPVGAAGSVAQVWGALQDCLAPPVQAGAPVTASARS